jgi:ATP/maltotriose-dependent transcriptional regulator MalT
MNTLSKLPGVIAVLGLAAGLPPHLSAKQSGAAVAPVADFAIRSGVPASDSELTPAVRAIVARGDALTGDRRYAAAEQEYRHASEIVRRQGHLPSFTLWHLACALYYEGNPQGAAAVLDQLTAEAQHSGDLAVEVLAMFNSAWLNGQSGNGRVAATKLESVRQLLRSPYMPAAIRDQLSTRIGEPDAVAVKR